MKRTARALVLLPESAFLFKKICTGLLILLGLLVVAAGAVYAAYWRPALAPIATPPPASFSFQVIDQGRILAGMGNCAACHTVKGGAAYAYYWRPALAPVNPPPPASFSAQAIEQGRILAGMGNCAACHTVKGGAAYAGGRGDL